MKRETLNDCVPPESLVKWSLAEAKRQNQRAESVAKYARSLEARVKEQDAAIAELQAVIAASPDEETKAARKAREKRIAKFRKHMTKYLGVLKTEIDYIQQLIDEAL